MSSAPDAIKRLVETFDRNIFDYKNSAYKEAHVRQEFINPLWHELGWDMANRAGLPANLREVIHEDSIEIDGNKKSPDYGFRKAGAIKFYLEAKAPRVYLKEDISPAFQIKSYAWSGGLPVSVLSDFEEFAVYQCTNRPKADDKTIKDRIAYFKYTDYIEKWDWLYERFSKDAVIDGRFDAFANTYAKKRGTQSFDKAFLADMHEWRTKLAQNIALRNPWIDERELNYAVQATLDRIIFLRIAEDRGIEKYGNLGVDAGLDYVLEAKSTKRRKVEGVYKTLLKRFKAADDRYNSGLFHFSKEKERGSHDVITPKLEIDDKVITKIIEQLYYPESPYAFDQVPADVLGSVYEQFLGQVITLSPSHKASIDYKPEVKKGGVYYTPKYIVDYIVKNTLGKLLDDVWCSGAVSAPGGATTNASGNGGTGVPPVTPLSVAVISKETTERSEEATEKSVRVEHNPPTADLTKLHKKASSLKVLDPACGSGSFLLGAYQYLLDWYHQFYTQTDPTHWVKQKAIEPLSSQHANAVISKEPTKRSAEATEKSPSAEQHARQRDYRLTTAERKRILLAHIHGVDIDSQAVEVAKLNLLLKASEGGNAQAQGQFTYDKNERLLPDLERNIVCGNSLVEWDITKMMKLTREDEERIKPFSFSQAFPDIMKAGGFDAVIGNPPYVRMESLTEFRDYWEFKFESYKERADLYVFFLEKSAKLLGKDGLFSMIVANRWIRSKYGANLRAYLRKNVATLEIIDFGELRIFEQAATMPSIYLAQRTVQGNTNTPYVPGFSKEAFEEVQSGKIKLESAVKVNQSMLTFPEDLEAAWTLNADDTSDILIKVAKSSVTLEQYVQGRILYGIKTGLVEAFIIDRETRDTLIRADKKLSHVIKPYIVGDNIRRNHIRPSGKWLIYTYKGIEISQDSPLLEYLKQFRARLVKRATKQEWYELQQSQFAYSKLFEEPKIVYPDIAKESRFAMDASGAYMADTTFSIPVEDYYLLAILNSQYAWSYFKSTCPVLGDSERGGRLRLKFNYVKNLPIPRFGNQAEAEISKLSKQVSELAARISRDGEATPTQQSKLKAMDADLEKMISDTIEAL